MYRSLVSTLVLVPILLLPGCSGDGDLGGSSDGGSGVVTLSPSGSNFAGSSSVIQGTV